MNASTIDDNNEQQKSTTIQTRKAEGRTWTEVYPSVQITNTN